MKSQKSETTRMKETAKATVKSIHDEMRQEYDYAAAVVSGGLSAIGGMLAYTFL